MLIDPNHRFWKHFRCRQLFPQQSKDPRLVLEREEQSMDLEALWNILFASLLGFFVFISFAWLLKFWCLTWRIYQTNTFLFIMKPILGLRGQTLQKSSQKCFPSNPFEIRFYKIIFLSLCVRSTKISFFLISNILALCAKKKKIK